MSDQFYNLRLQARGWLVENGQNQSQLSKLTNLSESFISDFLAGNCAISQLNALRLQTVVSKPLINLNAGARITNIQTTQKGQRFAQKIKGDVNLDGNMESARAKQMELQRNGVETIGMKLAKIKRGEKVNLIDPRTEDTI